MGKIAIDIDLTKLGLKKENLPTGLTTWNSKDGNVHINLDVVQLRQPDTYGKTHFVCVAQTKEEREAKKDVTYVGRGKEFNWDKNNNNSTQQASNAGGFEDDNDDMPF